MVNLNNKIKSKISNRLFFKNLLIIFIIILSIVIISFILINNNKNYKQPLLNENDNPSWVYKMIETSKKFIRISSLAKCYYKSKIVYYSTYMGNDFPNNLYNEHGNFICSPDGGFSGKGDGKCPNFDRENCITIYTEPTSH